MKLFNIWLSKPNNKRIKLAFFASLSMNVSVERTSIYLEKNVIDLVTLKFSLFTLV